MARSLDLLLVAVTAVFVCEATMVPALAAPATAEEKAARKQARADKKAKSEQQEKPAKQAKPAKPDKPAKQAKPAPTDTPTTGPSAPGGPPLPACPPDNTLTWRSFGAGFLLTWCTGCHSSHLGSDARQDAPDAVNFDSHANYKQHARIVYDRAVLEAHAFELDPNKGSPMPPAGVPPEADRQRLAQWIGLRLAEPVTPHHLAHPIARGSRNP